MNVKEALQLIVSCQECPALNYAVNYAKEGLRMLEEGECEEMSHEFKVQMLYVMGNIGRWRGTKSDPAMTMMIKEARLAIKRAAGVK